MSDVIKVNITTLQNDKKKFDREYTSFYNTTYGKFKSSYLGQSSDPTVNKMYRQLLSKYQAIDKAYKNIDKWWDSYNKNILGLENVLSRKTTDGAIQESSVRSLVIRNLRELPRYSAKDITVKPATYQAPDLNLGTSSVGTPSQRYMQIFAEYNGYKTYKDVLSDFGSEAKKWIDEKMAEAQKVGGDIFENIGCAWNNLVEGADHFFDESVKWWKEEAYSAITGFMDDLFKNLQDTGATIVTFGISFIEGVAQFGEAIFDMGATCFGAVGGVFTSIYDSLTGSNVTEGFKNDVKALVAEDYVTSVFNDYYENNPYGKWLKEHTYGFDMVRSIGNGFGYMSAVMFTATLTFGGSNILAGGEITLATSAQTGAVAGLGGFGKGAQTSYAKGANFDQGLGAALLTSMWDAGNFYLGTKINQFNLVGEGGKFAASNMSQTGMKLANIGTRVTLDGTTNGLSTFADVYIESTYSDKSKEQIFEEMGGMNTVFANMGTGALFSTYSESGIGSRIIKKVTTPLKAKGIKGINYLKNLFGSGDTDNIMPRMTEVEAMAQDLAKFDDFDVENYNYGVDQDAARKLIRWKEVGKDWYDESSLKAFIKKELPAMDLDEAYNILTSGDIRDNNIEPYIFKYIQENSSSYEAARDVLERNFKMNKSPELQHIIDKYTKQGLTESEVLKVLRTVNSTGACSYAATANAIVDAFSNTTKGIDKFAKCFGFDLFVPGENGKLKINSAELLTDMYICCNSTKAGGKMFELNDDGIKILDLDSENQQYLSGFIIDSRPIVNRYLKSKDSRLSYDFVKDLDMQYAPEKSFEHGWIGIPVAEDMEEIKTNFKSFLETGKPVRLGVYATDKEMHFNNMDGTLEETTHSWNEGGGHAVYVTEAVDDGIIVSSWGKKLKIPYEDFVGNKFICEVIEFSGIDDID